MHYISYFSTKPDEPSFLSFANESSKTLFKRFIVKNVTLLPDRKKDNLIQILIGIRGNPKPVIEELFAKSV